MDKGLQRIDGIAINPMNPAHQQKLLQKLAERTILISYGTDAPGSGRRVHIGNGHYAAGRLCGKLVKEALPKGGKVIIFSSQKKAPAIDAPPDANLALERHNAKLRHQGLVDELAGIKNTDAPPAPDQGEEAPKPVAKAPKIVVDFYQLERRRDGLRYFEEKPFTGVAVWKHENGLKRSESIWKDGKRDGLSTGWHKNRQKHFEAIYKDGKMHGLHTIWYENGQKSGESTHKDGNLVTATALKTNGEKCPVTNIVDGTGIWCGYHENGQKHWERTFKDGKMHGLSTRWYENGQKKMEITCKDGIGNSDTRKEWDEDGNPR
jgi:antitoxin component YwqK of YwqJK toxin-antitoxin module